jgi:hypothetical protein
LAKSLMNNISKNFPYQKENWCEINWKDIEVRFFI